MVESALLQFEDPLAARALKLVDPVSHMESAWPRGGALLTGFLLAVHASQIVPGKTARMYGFGCFWQGSRRGCCCEVSEP